ncbi:MAG: YSC84-related protein [Desulfobacterales bacterium]|nr:YSC84-related protein [Desulfobacterales bacterium]
MKKSRTRLLSVLFSIIISTMVFGFAIPATAAEPIEQQGLVDKARITFESFMTDQNQSWLRENLNQAKGLIIIPSLLKAGFVIGGSGGSGVLIVKDDKTGQWSQPAFYTIGSGTFGFQIGAEAAEVIMMVRTQKAVDRLFTSSFKLGGDTSVAVGPVGTGVKSNVVADIFSFSRTKGAYVGVSLEGSVIKTRDKWNEAYYGKAVRPIDIIVKRSVSNPNSAKLIKTVTQAASATSKEPISHTKERYYVVRSGDTLYGIAKQQGISVDELCRLNTITKTDPIHPGQKLLVTPSKQQ